MNLDTLIVPLDGSNRAEAAIPYAEALRRATGASLLLLTVLEPLEHDLPPAAVDAAAQWQQAERTQQENYLEYWRTTLQEAGAVTTTTLTVGQPAEQILAAAQASNVSLIVMATAGRGGVERWAIGSVADKVMRLSRKPVLLIRPHERHAGRRPVHLLRLLTPLDGSAPAEAAIPVVADLARALSAKLVLLRAVPLPLVWPAGAPPDLGGPAALVLNEAERYLVAVRQKMPDSLGVTTQALWGAPTQAIKESAKQNRIDLVVMTTHGRGGLSRLVLGSTADRLVRAGLPVLLVPTGELDDG